MNAANIVAYVLLAVIALPGGAILLWMVWVLWYSRMTLEQRTDLAGTELRHYTSHDVGAKIDHGDGTIAITPRPGWRGVVVEVAHQNWGALLGRPHAVYLYAGVPSDNERHFHGHANDVVVRISGNDVLAQHPGRLHRSPRDSAIAIRGGYRGPGVVEPTAVGDQEPAPRTQGHLQHYLDVARRTNH